MSLIGINEICLLSIEDPTCPTFYIYKMNRQTTDCNYSTEEWFQKFIHDNNMNVEDAIRLGLHENKQSVGFYIGNFIDEEGNVKYSFLNTEKSIHIVKMLNNLETHFDKFRIRIYNKMDDEYLTNIVNEKLDIKKKTIGVIVNRILESWSNLSTELPYECVIDKNSNMLYNWLKESINLVP